ncbi:MAG TPA: hypothetical protein VG122_19085 [Gemmata sp.]|jgi:hypothetical protein|nr:hypothetical protein [Gemmata sp.]
MLRWCAAFVFSGPIAEDLGSLLEQFADCATMTAAKHGSFAAALALDPHQRDSDAYMFAHLLHNSHGRAVEILCIDFALVRNAVIDQFTALRLAAGFGSEYVCDLAAENTQRKTQGTNDQLASLQDGKYADKCPLQSFINVVLIMQACPGKPFQTGRKQLG